MTELQKRREFTRKQAHELRSEGLSYREISARLHIANATVYKYLRQYASTTTTAVEYFCRCCSGVVTFRGNKKTAECNLCKQSFRRDQLDALQPKSTNARTATKLSYYAESASDHLGKRNKPQKQ
jgi:hypothetical protein